MVVGQDPFDVEGTWQHLFALTYTSVRGIAALSRQRRQLVTATGAIRIFDLTWSYVIAFELFIAIYAVGSIAAFACRSYETENSRNKIAPAVASA